MKRFQIAEDDYGRKLTVKFNCRKCFGRGYIGYARSVKGAESVISEGMVPCDCVLIIDGNGMTAPKIPVKKAGLIEKIKKTIKNTLTFARLKCCANNRGGQTWLSKKSASR